jgi:hypothetical protein
MVWTQTDERDCVTCSDSNPRGRDLWVIELSMRHWLGGQGSAIDVDGLPGGPRALRG